MLRIPFYSLRPQHEETHNELLAAFEEVLAYNSFVLGSKLAEFERAYAEYINARYCAGVSNGFDALTIALQAMGIGQGHEVIVPSHTFIATWLAVTAVGAVPVPVDVDLITYNIDPNKIESAVSRRTKAIIPVHLYGLPCDMSSIIEIARHYKLAVIEDNAQAHGARYRGQSTGSIGLINATSFYPTKNLGALGGGGAITTNDPELDNKVRLIRNYGSDTKHLYTEFGTNSRLDDLQAAFLSVKLNHLGAWNAERVSIAENYQKGLDGVGDIILPTSDNDALHAYHLFVVRTLKRDALRDYLLRSGIETAVHYPVPCYLQEVYKGLGFKRGTYPNAEAISAQCLSLPLWVGLTSDEVALVCETVRKFFDKA